MVERLRALWERFLAWWQKFTTRQKTLIGSIAAVVVVALAILIVVVTQPTWVTLRVCDNATEAAEIIDLLEAENITYQSSQDGLTIKVKTSDEASAHWILGSNNISSDGYSIDDVFDGSFSTTESDKSKKYQLYLEELIASELVDTLEVVDAAEVNLSIPDNDGTILSQQEETYAAVLLTLNGELEDDAAVGIAKFVATAVGDDSTDNITILDSNSNTLFAGGDSDSDSVYAVTSSQQAVLEKAEEYVKSQVSDVLLGSELYDNVEIGLNLSIDFDEEEVVDKTYSVADGNTQGYLDSETTYTEETEGGTAGVPGTDSNDETTYVIDDDGYTSSTIEEITRDYLPNETVTTTTKAPGTITADESSISVVCTNYVVYDEETMEDNGELDGTTFEAFVSENNEITEAEVDDTYITMVSNATGIPEENITIMAYDVPFFQYKDSGAGLSDYLQFIIAAIILLMLGFVIFRSTRTQEEEEEIEPELSVEGLLESTKESEESQLEEIGFTERSETRIMIEKFVDENPEAVAALLRNWIEDTGDWE